MVQPVNLEVLEQGPPLGVAPPAPPHPAHRACRTWLKAAALVAAFTPIAIVLVIGALMVWKGVWVGTR